MLKKICVSFCILSLILCFSLPCFASSYKGEKSEPYIPMFGLTSFVVEAESFIDFDLKGGMYFPLPNLPSFYPLDPNGTSAGRISGEVSGYGPQSFSYKAVPTHQYTRYDFTHNAFKHSNSVPYALVSTSPVVANSSYWADAADSFTYEVHPGDNFFWRVAFILKIPTETPSGDVVFTTKQIQGTGLSANSGDEIIRPSLLNDITSWTDDWTPQQLGALDWFIIEDFTVFWSNRVSSSRNDFCVYVPYIRAEDAPVQPLITRTITEYSGNPFSWLIDTAEGFLSIELFPGVTIGLISSIFVMVCVAVALLKLWAGG